MTTENLKLVDSWPILECDDSIVHWEGRFQCPDGTYVTRVWIEQYGIQCGGLMDPAYIDRGSLGD